MADGKGIRWNNYLGIPKHFVEVDGEMLISRTVRLLRKICGANIEIIVTSHDERYEFIGSNRHEPLCNEYEIDRFTEELIEDDMCFLYGDTYYTEESINYIVNAPTDDILFFGDRESVVAVKIKNSELFKQHKNMVRNLYLDKIIEKCKGWQIYQSFTNQDINEKPQIKDKFILIEDKTRNINTPDDYEKMVSL